MMGEATGNKPGEAVQCGSLEHLQCPTSDPESNSKRSPWPDLEGLYCRMVPFGCVGVGQEMWHREQVWKQKDQLRG